MSKKYTKIKAMDTLEPVDSTGRQRQTKRDEAIRKKLEQEFSKKKSTNSSRTYSLNRRIPGTVSALRPGKALTVKESLLVIESAQLMAAKRCDCVLVVDDDDRLSGIFTAKDIAYRVVAEGLDAGTTCVIDIMTKNPLCVTSDTSATDALNLMVAKGFRHLPVCNDEGDIFGLLDITKCLYGALEKIERAFEPSQKLFDALEDAEREQSVNTVQLTEYLETLRDRMSCPNLASVLDGSPPAEVKYKTNVRDIAIMMKQMHTTAVLVTKHHKLAGIFTSKDIVLRVIAAGLNPENCTVVRVMTPNPDTANSSTSVLDALKLMNVGHYLNLPVLDNGIITGMVDVLKLTYVTLEQMYSIQGNEGEGGPMWSRFWASFGAIDQAETESQMSDNSSHINNKSFISAVISPQPSTSLSLLKSFSDISPNESASMVNNDHSSVTMNDCTVTSGHQDTFPFKFTCNNNKTHRLVCKTTYPDLLESIRTKVQSDYDVVNGMEEWLSMSYLDDEEDEVLISCDSDVADAVRLALKVGQTRVKLFVHDNRSTIHKNEDSLASLSTSESSLKTIEDVPIRRETKQRERSVSPPKRKKSTAPKASSTDLLLPTAIGFLGVAIIGVFVYSRMQSSSRY
ncbi:hypothetical protein BDB01DRAFT_839868 [Pilobolus umbonatus]|nr:hypothetical protein BDB01DRAFT_839868 [Pilobolus umbonatus]